MAGKGKAKTKRASRPKVSKTVKTAVKQILQKEIESKTINVPVSTGLTVNSVNTPYGALSGVQYLATDVFSLTQGARDFVVIKDKDELKTLRRRFDLVLNTISVLVDLNAYLGILKIDGTMVIIGLPDSPYAVNAGALLDGRKSLTGSMIGGMPELQEMLDFAGKHNIVSEIELVKADYVDKAYERTVASDVKYRFVIDASSF